MGTAIRVTFEEKKAVIQFSRYVVVSGHLYKDPKTIVIWSEYNHATSMLTQLSLCCMFYQMLGLGYLVLAYNHTNRNVVHTHHLV